MAKLNKYMFREYDIRGRETPDELNKESVDLITRAYAAMLSKRKIKTAVLGHDNRKSSEEFYDGAKKALTASGINVIGIGMILTPMMYWAQYYFKVKGGMIISASHNPVGWNGFKMSLGYSHTLVGDEVQEVYERATNQDFVIGKGNFRKDNIKKAYIKDLVSRAKLHRKLKILVNTANATSSFYSPDLFRDFGCEVVEHNTNPDPSYPNYPPNPANVEMMEDTADQTVRNKCDIGIAIDADGDRLGIADERGNVIWPDRWFILLSRLILEKDPGAKIIFDVKVSEALPEDIKAHGGVPIMWKTGHSFIKQKLHEEKAAAAGEMSGHIFYVKDYYGFDDANFAALKLLEYVSLQGKPLSEIIADTPYYVSTPAYHAEVPDEKKYNVVEQITKEFKDEGRKVIDINGARVYFEDNSWGLVRASSNLPALVIRFEAKTEEKLKEIEKMFKEKLEKFPEVAKEWTSA